LYLVIGSKDVRYDDIDWTGSNYATAGCAFEKVSISAGKIINAGVTFARGVKDTPLYLSHAGAYEQEIHHAGAMNVVLYDMRDRRGWLIDGASALLHLTCTQLSTVWSHKSQLLDLQQFQYAEPRNGTSAASVALLDQRNREIAIFEEVDSWKEVTTTIEDLNEGLEPVRKEEHKIKTTKWCYQDLVRQTYHILELIQDYQVKMLTCPGTNLRFTDREKLEGFAFMDIVDGPGAILPRVAILKPSGRGWVDFTRSIRAITLLGKGFGEVIRVAKNTNKLCRSWQHVPTGQDYLVACIAKLREICRKEGDGDAVPLELARGICWHKAHLMFEPCTCKKGQPDSACDRIQVLLPRSLGPKKHPRPFTYVNGAVVFGRSKKLNWSWPNKGNPTQGDDSNEEDCEPYTSHDSGLGTSIPFSSSDDENLSSSLSRLPVTTNHPSPQGNSPAAMSETLEVEAEQRVFDFQHLPTNTSPLTNLRILDIRHSLSTAEEALTIPENSEGSGRMKRTWDMVKEKSLPVSNAFKKMRADNTKTPARSKDGLSSMPVTEQEVDRPRTLRDSQLSPDSSTTPLLPGFDFQPSSIDLFHEPENE
jgi:hypothetical protein